MHIWDDPEIDWWSVQGITRLSLGDKWDTLQPPVTPDWLQQVQKTNEGKNTTIYFDVTKYHTVL